MEFNSTSATIEFEEKPVYPEVQIFFTKEQNGDVITDSGSNIVSRMGFSRSINI